MPVASPTRSSAATRPPNRSLEQRLSALQKAQHVRIAKAAFKRKVKSGQADVVRAIVDPPDYLLTAKVFEVLLAVPKWGRVRVNRLLVSARISPSKPLGGLTERQRDELVSRVRDGGC